MGWEWGHMMLQPAGGHPVQSQGRLYFVLDEPRSNRTSAMSEETGRLSRLKSCFQLSDFQLAHLLGADRTALRQWRKAGIPKRRMGDVEALEKLAEVLGAELARTVMHWPHSELDSKSPFLAVRTLGTAELCARLARMNTE